MKPSEILDRQRAVIREAVIRHRMTNPRVFGSVARGEDRADSDLDLLVDACAGATLFDLGGLQEELREIMGVNIDVLTPADLPGPAREQALSEARPV